MSTGLSDYSPLPQSNSDSDGSSEEELHTPGESKIINRVSKSTTSLLNERVYNGPKQNDVNYKPLDTDADIGAVLTNFHSHSDKVSIIRSNSRPEKFSTSRKICFVFSLLLCVLTTVVFIWVLPCNVAPCLSPLSKYYFTTWVKTLPELELYGPISTVPDSISSSQNLVFLYQNFSKLNLVEVGLLSYKGNNGDDNWQISLEKQATDIDCKLLDVNLDGFNDCLVIGSNYLKSINSLSGKEFWDVYTSNNKNLKVQRVDFPLVVPDLNGDGVNDLVTACAFTKRNQSSVGYQNNLVIISGKSGQVISNPLEVTLCTEIHNLMFENNSVISYTCYNSTKKESLQTMSLFNVYNSVKNMTKKKLSFYKWEKLSQHQGDPKNIQINNYRLAIENRGHCPEDCIVEVTIKDERRAYSNKTVLNFTYENTFGVAAKSEKLGGFIFKFWKWRLNRKNERFKKLKLPENATGLGKEMLLESKGDFKRFKRSDGSWIENNPYGIVQTLANINLRVITESLIAITFNETHPLVQNITENEIIQICHVGQQCKPDINRLKHSIAITDLDKDDFEEAVSFSSKYVHEASDIKESIGTWRLQSTIHVLKL